MLIAVARPWRNWPRDAPILPLLGLGLSMAVTILLFFLAIERLPLGTTVALQFLGPLSVAVFGSRRPTDLIWALLAGFGVWCLVGPAPHQAAVDHLGIVFALAAAGGWASYILLGRTAGASFGNSAAALSVSIAGLLMLPIGIGNAGTSLLTPELLPLAFTVALFSAAVPFSLELYALPRLPARTFAVFTSLEPAFAVISGFIILNEVLVWSQIAGVSMVIIASAGAAWRVAKPPAVQPS